MQEADNLNEVWEGAVLPSERELLGVTAKEVETSTTAFPKTLISMRCQQYLM